MRSTSVIGGSISIALAAILAAYLSAASGYGPWNMMGGHGPGMMRGYGPGAMFRDGNPAGLSRFDSSGLSVDDVKARFERWLIMQGNPRLKIGDVKETDGNAITVDVVTQENSLVQRFIVDRRTGYHRPTGG
jgi:hypothetical protein